MAASIVIDATGGGWANLVVPLAQEIFGCEDLIFADCIDYM